MISPEPPPDGWRGKTWACRRGVDAAEPSVQHLLFLDADTRFEPGGLRRIFQTYFGGAGVLSVLPYHRVATAGEQLSAVFNVIMAAGAGGWAPGAGGARGLFGQMLLIERRTYEAIGGHEPVKSRVLENLHLAEHLRSAGVPLRCASGRGTLQMRMYPEGVGELTKGWAKGFVSGAGSTSHLVMLLSVAWLSGATTAVAGLVQRPDLVAAAVYALFAAQFFWITRRCGTYWLLTALLYPVPLAFFFVVFGYSALRSGKPVMWKGRWVHAD